MRHCLVLLLDCFLTASPDSLWENHCYVLVFLYPSTNVQVCIYGKPEGAGTGVTLSNTHYAGLGVPIPFDESTGICDAVSIRGLVANESYVSCPVDMLSSWKG